jgi:diguanylate cyclase (GGDEF)-like protein/PAS domain S-box-containing protein
MPQQPLQDDPMSEGEESYRKVFELSPDAILIHCEGLITLANPACVKLAGVGSLDELIGRRVMDFIHPDQRAHMEEGWRRMEMDRRPVSAVERRIIRSDGVMLDVEMSGVVLSSEGPAKHLAMVRDITERKRAQSRLQHLAGHDSLTGLPNRAVFHDRLERALARAKRDQKLVALMYIDVDRLKEINDTRGHAVGDEVLKTAAARMRHSLREMDTVARIGGDEFAAILENSSSESEVRAALDRILGAFSAPMVAIGGSVTVSIGIALSPVAGEKGETLMQNADIALYHSKNAGRNTYAFFEPQMSARATEQRSIESGLRRALERDELELHYQPKVSLATGRMVGVEALARWNSQELGAVSPGRFIPVAEETGLIVPIGEWVLTTACAQAQAWAREGFPLPIAVNVSPRQLRQRDIVQTIAAVLRDTGLPPERLELEITEGMIMDDLHGSIEQLEQLRALGVSIAIDDFGTGYSSLGYLAKLPLQTLKIDRTFISALETDSHAMTLVSTIMSLARALNLKVVAEGVETVEQQSILRGMDCAEMQGYLFSRPLSADKMHALLAEQGG